MDLKKKFISSKWNRSNEAALAAGDVWVLDPQENAMEGSSMPWHPRRPWAVPVGFQSSEVNNSILLWHNPMYFLAHKSIQIEFSESYSLIQVFRVEDPRFKKFDFHTIQMVQLLDVYASSLHILTKLNKITQAILAKFREFFSVCKTEMFVKL